MCFNAKNILGILKLAGRLVNIIGHGLEALRGSVVLKQIDLSTVGKHESRDIKPSPSISEEVV